MNKHIRELPEITFLYDLSLITKRVNLEIMRELLNSLGNPHIDGVKYVHVTGTNGKGSVCASVYAVLRERYHVGLYLSPHVYRFNERIIVDDEEIEDEYIVNFVKEVRTILEEIAKKGRRPSFFEVTTAMAFQYFKEKKCDFSVIEVGLGGRLDPTNVIHPLVSAVTSIDLEHTHILGDTVEKIAFEKAGIIKPHIPVVSGVKNERAIKIIRDIAKKRKAPFYDALSEYEVYDVNIGLGGMKFKVLGGYEEYKISFPLIGRHQINNVIIALKILELLREKYRIERKDIESGLSRVKLPGRFEVKMKNPLLIFDIAHNPAASKALVNTIRELKLENVTFLFSILKDKDVNKILENLSQVSDEIIITEINDERRRMPAEEIEKYARKYFRNIEVIKESRKALEHALEKSDVAIATGSAYLLGELEEHLHSLTERSPYLSGEQVDINLEHH